jgi:hypothetical protein
MLNATVNAKLKPAALKRWTCFGLSYLKRFMQNNTYTDTKHYHQRNRRRHAKVA